MQRCLYLAQDFLGVLQTGTAAARMWNHHPLYFIVIYSDHKVLTDLTYWNKFVIFVNDKYFNKQVYFKNKSNSSK